MATIQGDTNPREKAMKKLAANHISIVNALLLATVSALSVAAIVIPSSRAAVITPAEAARLQ